MALIHKIRDYLIDDKLQINVFKDKVNIINYKEIGHFDMNKVIVRYEGGSIFISGTSLVVSKLLNDEVLITGNIKNIEFR